MANEPLTAHQLNEQELEREYDARKEEPELPEALPGASNIPKEIQSAFTWLSLIREHGEYIPAFRASFHVSDNGGGPKLEAYWAINVGGYSDSTETKGLFFQETLEEAFSRAKFAKRQAKKGASF